MANSSVTQAAATNVEPQGITCAVGCAHRRSGLFRAMLYTPVVLMLCGLAALATFPKLAEYAAPLIGDSAEKNSCSSMSCTASGGGHCCSSMNASVGGCSESAMSLGGCCLGTNCESGETESASVDSEEPIRAELTSADASVVDNQIEAETPSN